MKLGFKATDKNMSCRGFQYELGVTYYKDVDKVLQKLNFPVLGFKEPTLDTNIKMCSGDGIHYCNTLEQTSKFYANNGDNRFFVVEILSDFNEDDEKAATKGLRFVREITKDELLQKEIDRKLNLDLVQKFVTDFPTAIIGGSLGLFLAGAKLKRVIENGVNDIDIIMPYFVDISEKEYVEDCEEYPSGADFDTSYIIGKIKKLDLVIDPKRKYKEITYNGFTYKVADYRQTILAKLNYSIKGNKKHTQDLNELIFGKILQESDLPF